MAGKERLFAHPRRTRSAAAGGRRQTRAPRSSPSRNRTGRSTVGFGGITVDSRIAPDVMSLAKKYHGKVTAGYDPGGPHAADGDHPKGLAIDIIPSAGGSWDDIDDLAAFAAKHPEIFRFVGYDGRFGTTAWPGHGRGKHLHLSWHGGGTAGDTAPLKTLGRVAKGTVTPRSRGRGASTPADWLKQAGWPSNLIPTMVAIGGAESGWNIGAESPKNDNGTIDYGWLQVNSVHGYDPSKLKSDPVYNARAAYSIYKKQGLAAWSTYNSGAYQGFMGKTPDVKPGRVRPGGEADSGTGSNGNGGGSSGGGGSDPDTELVSYWGALIPGGAGAVGLLPNPLDLFKSATKAVNSGKDFMKWIAWIFHPLNLLRMVEFWTGFNLIIGGFVAIIFAWKGGDAEDIVSVMPQGRALKAVKGARGAKVASTGRELSVA